MERIVNAKRVLVSTAVNVIQHTLELIVNQVWCDSSSSFGLFFDRSFAYLNIKLIRLITLILVHKCSFS